MLPLLAAALAGLPGDPRFELDEMGEPEWNMPAPPPPPWTLTNLSNVYQDDYEKPRVWRQRAAATVSACQLACTANTTCTSYTFTPGPNPGAEGCRYTDECWLRSDHVWHPKLSHNCAGMSGYKGAAPSPGPAPPGPPAPPPPPPPPPPPGALNVLFVIFDDLRPNTKLAYGLEQPSMPNVDKLAAKGMTFDHAYCNQAVCGPSRASPLGHFERGPLGPFCESAERARESKGEPETTRRTQLLCLNPSKG